MRASVIVTSLLGLLALAAVAAPRPALAQQSAEDDESALLVREARTRVQRGDYDQAGKLLDRAIALNPRRIEAYLLRASVHAVKKEYRQGVALMRRARELAPDDADVQVALGTQLMLAGDIAEGVPLLEQAAARWPKRYDAHVVLGHHYADHGEWTRAIAALEAYLSTRPKALAGEDHLHQITLADAYMRSGDAARARALFEQVVKAHPKDRRARIGRAWAAAASDCRQALPLLAELADLTADYPEVWLVEGRCALLVGQVPRAVSLAKKYVSKRDGAAAGHGLLGEALAEADDLAGARQALGRARALEPANRRWTFKLARVERIAGEPARAVELLTELGPGGEDDAEYAVELAEALLAAGRPADAIARVAPVVAGHPEDAAALTVLGLASYANGDAAAAIEPLERALAIKPTARARLALVDALNVVAAAAIAAADDDGAEARLERAAALGGSVATSRNLGVVRLLRGRAGEAIQPLEQAAQAGDGVAAQLLGRAHGQSGDAQAAREAFAAAVKLAGNDLARRAEIALDLAAMELRAGEADRAVDALEALPANKLAEALRERVAEALAQARHAAALAAMGKGAAGRALKLLELVEKQASGAALVAARCDLALAATVAGDRDGALKRLRALAKANASCPFPAPADKQAVPLLIALNEGMVAARAAKSLGKLEQAAKQPGVLGKLASAAARVVAMNAAAAFFAKGNTKKAGELLARAKKQEARQSPELTHDLMAIEVAEGRAAGAVATLEKLTADLPEAWVTLGLAYEQLGKPVEALRAFEQAQQAGVRFPPLAEWIAAKQRLFGGAS